MPETSAHPNDRDAVSTMQRDVQEAVRQLHLARALSFARPGTISLRLPDGRMALSTLQIIENAEARPVAVLAAGGAMDRGRKKARPA